MVSRNWYKKINWNLVRARLVFTHKAAQSCQDRCALVLLYLELINIFPAPEEDIRYPVYLTPP